MATKTITLSKEARDYREKIDEITGELWGKYGPNSVGFGGYVNVPGRPDNYFLAASPGPIEREQEIIAALSRIESSRDEAGEFASAEDKKAYNDLFKGLEALNRVREASGLEENQIILASTARRAVVGLDDVRETESRLSDLRGGITKTKVETSTLVNAKEEERRALLSYYDDDELTDEEKAGNIKTTYQCYLTYNIEYFSNLHKKLLVSKVPDKGYRGLNEEQITQATGYVKGDLSPRIYLSQESDDSALMINKLKICPESDRFSRIKTQEYAQLIPFLKLFKVYRNREDMTGAGMIEMEFDTRTSRDGIEKKLEVVTPQGELSTDKRFSKGTSCGIKSFDWSFIGSDHFTATRDIDATLKLFFQDMSELTKVRRNKNLLNVNGVENKTYKYLDLLVLPYCRKKKTRYSSSFNPECYEIRIDVGYTLPQNVHNFDPELKKTICCQRDSLYLTPTSHKFEFNEDGTIELSINYKGRIENIMNDKKFNVLMPGGGFYDIKFDNSIGKKTSIQEIEEEILAEEEKKKPNKKRIISLKRERTIFFLNYGQIFHNSILSKMNELGYVHKRTISAKEYYQFGKWRIGSTPEPPPLRPDTTFVLPDEGSVNSVLIDLKNASRVTPEDSSLTESTDLSDFNQRLLKARRGKNHVINYFFLGDLIGVVSSTVFGDYFFQSAKDNSGNEIELVYDPSPVSSTRDIIDNFHLILGNSNFTIVEKEMIINLAHIPVSLEIFHQFMLTKVIGQDLTFYSYAEFIDDLISYVVIDILSNECFDGALGKDALTSTALFTTQNGLNEEVLEAASPDTYKAINFSKVTPDSNVVFDLCKKDSIEHKLPKDYLVIDTIESFPKNLNGTLEPGIRGDNIGDRARGIYHFALGQNNGIVKKATFNKQDQEWVSEARYTAGDNFIFNQISNVYDVNFEMLGNNLFKNGMFIYFESAPFGAGFPWERVEDRAGEILKQSWANIMGLGGYHLVTEVNHSIKPGSYVTSVKARWQTGGQGIVNELVVTNEEITEAQQLFDGAEAMLMATVQALGSVPEDQRDGHPLQDELYRLQAEYNAAYRKLSDLKKER